MENINIRLAPLPRQKPHPRRRPISFKLPAPAVHSLPRAPPEINTMSTFTEDSTDHLECLFESIPGEPGTELDQRLERLEKSIENYASKLDRDILNRLQSLEDLLDLQITNARTDIAREASERREQFAALATTISRKIDRLQRCAERLQQEDAGESTGDSE